MKTIKCTAAILLALCLSSQAKADQIVSVSLAGKVLPGHMPSISVSVFQDIKSLTLSLTRDDGKKIRQTKNNIPRGSKRTFELPQARGTHTYRGTLEAELYNAPKGTMNLNFSATVMQSMKLEVSAKDLDLNEHLLRIRAARPMTEVDYEITSDSNQTLALDTYKAPRASSVLEFHWKQASGKKNQGKVMKIHLVAHDENGFTEEMDLYPWSWSIPHEEVVFDTGKWEILPDQAPKLDESYKLLKEGLQKYGSMLPIKLYIAGFTDTVSDAQYNLRLSEKRAIAIARYFRKKGFKYPIYYHGFGERGLKVPTPDNTDEPKNRRAEYVLAAQPPTVNIEGTSCRWKKL